MRPALLVLRPVSARKRTVKPLVGNNHVSCRQEALPYVRKPTNIAHPQTQGTPLRHKKASKENLESPVRGAGEIRTLEPLAQLTP